MRAAILFSVSVVSLGACASNTAAPIDYRAAGLSGNPSRAAVAPKQAAPVQIAAATTVPAAPRLMAPSTNPSVLPPERTSSPAVAEARDLTPEMSPRPGGPLKQARASASQRRVHVKAGDSVYDISRRHSVNMRALIETNALEPPYTLNPGQVVMLPQQNIHVVERGETLYSVSRRYNIDTRSLAVMNGLERPWTVWPGDELLLPSLARDEGRRAEPVAATQPAPQVLPAPPKPSFSSPPPSQGQPSQGLASKAPVVAPPAAAPVVMAPAPTTPKSTGPAGPISLVPKSQIAATSGLFIWPVSGPVLSGFGIGPDGTKNDGVNIAAAPGTQVRAAAAGDVVYAGNELTGFGNLLLIRHADGWVSAYAHADRLLVKEGQRVTQGQVVAEAGGSARNGKPQLHFELRKGKDPVDPMLHLPRAG